ncbi:PDR/VanB family oxidoreductase [Actinomadura sp. 9N407]|uniref:PDR/VanB family oxidoreductase n=1 Tax=Actinomadura sp. 9N407 TaxID=3375154 RepID=UPI00378864AE
MKVVLARKERAADGVAALTLRDPGGGPLPSWEAGAHIDLVLRDDLVRRYSLCGDPSDTSGWRLAVLREDAGRGGSSHVHDHLQEGAVLDVRGPRNHFAYEPSRRALFIAGGIGITPVLPMLAAAEAAGVDWRLLYGGRRRSSMAFLPELARYGERVQVRPQDETGLLDLDAVLAEPEPDTLVYCCGPEPLLAAVEERCARWPPGSLRVERFTASPQNLEGDTGFEVELALSGRTVRVPPDGSILGAVEEAGIAALSSCREGTCGTCETAVLGGEPDHRDGVLTEAERRDAGVMMICVSRSLTPRLVLEL